MSTTIKYEIFENGDPHSRAWDCIESTDGGTTWFYRGDISGQYRKKELIATIRALNPNCEIVNRYSRRKIK